MSDLEIDDDPHSILEAYFDYLFDCLEYKSRDFHWISGKIMEMATAFEQYGISYGLHNYGFLFAEKLPYLDLRILIEKIQSMINNRDKERDQLPSLLADLNDCLEASRPKMAP